MLFNSYIFILFFLPLCLVVYFLLHKIKTPIPAQIFLAGMSLWFYGYANPSYLAIICTSILINYLLYLLLRKRDHIAKRKFILVIDIVFNLGLLGYYKYMDFFISNINALFKSDLQLLHIVLPLGISFFTFQQISFAVDSYKGEIPKCSFLEYVCFVAFFPQLVAGPIASHEEILPQLRDPKNYKPSWQNLSQGFYIFTIGLSKKLLLADTFGKMSDLGHTIVQQGILNPNTYTATLNTPEALLVMLSYTFQLYFDFSGYCDMAVGIGKMMNINLPINFDSPYKAVNPGEFWNRWHMTLNRFFTKYVYIPMGGSRKGKLRTCVNVLFVFFISGFWHGASWGFIFWGLINGVCVAIYRLLRKYIDKLPKVLTWFFTFISYSLSLVFFRADSVTAALAFFKRIFSFKFGAVQPWLYEGFLLTEFEKVLSITPLASYASLILMIGFFLLSFIIILGCKNASQKMNSMADTKPISAIPVALLFVWCVVSLGGISTFLYFNF